MSKPPPKKKKNNKTKNAIGSAFAIYPGLFPWLNPNDPNMISPTTKGKKIHIRSKGKAVTRGDRELFRPIQEERSATSNKDPPEVIDLCSDVPVIIDMTGIPDDDAAVARLEVVEKKKSVKKKKIVKGDTIFDDSMHGTPVDIIKDRHPLFYTYDPRGIEKGVDLPPAYCSRCRCPLNYCAEKVFGSMIEKRCDYEIYKRMGVHVYHDKYEIQMIFEKFYTEAVTAKLMWNNINFEFDHRNMVRRLYIPGCMKYRSFRRVIKDYILEKDRLNYLMYDNEEQEVDEAEESTRSNKI